MCVRMCVVGEEEDVNGASVHASTTQPSIYYDHMDLQCRFKDVI